ncbi:MAG: LysM peptidoglycan-binding domain-containing protein [Phyllobacteriaceae bacterium]|nr:LysM peptidoglycan-binding domain-containing protein [Phyllobacteriaceae bacterium]
MPAVAAKVDQPLAVSPGENDGRYKVASGDSLYAIAKKSGVSVAQLRAANGLTDQSVLKVGQVLNLPRNVASAAPGMDGVDGNVTGKRTSAGSRTASVDTMPDPPASSRLRPSPRHRRRPQPARLPSSRALRCVGRCRAKLSPRFARRTMANPMTALILRCRPAHR